MNSLFKNNILILIITTLILGVSACEKPKVIPVNADIIEHFYYKPGSYWIYKDIISGRTDSFAVVSNHNYITSDIQNLVIGVLDESTDTFSFDWNLYENTIRIQFTRNGEFIHTSADYQYPLSVNFISYNVNGISYSNVEEVIYSNDSFYINDNVGLIKIILNDPNDNIVYAWELLRYKINL